MLVNLLQKLFCFFFFYLSAFTFILMDQHFDKDSDNCILALLKNRETFSLFFSKDHLTWIHVNFFKACISQQKHYSAVSLFSKTHKPYLNHIRGKQNSSKAQSKATTKVKSWTVWCMGSATGSAHPLLSLWRHWTLWTLKCAWMKTPTTRNPYKKQDVHHARFSNTPRWNIHSHVGSLMCSAIWK